MHFSCLEHYQSNLQQDKTVIESFFKPDKSILRIKENSTSRFEISILNLVLASLFGQVKFRISFFGDANKTVNYTWEMHISHFFNPIVLTYFQFTIRDRYNEYPLVTHSIDVETCKWKAVTIITGCISYIHQSIAFLELKNEICNWG